MTNDKRPNILFIMSDDHAAHAMSCYGSRINETPNMDRIAKEGMIFTNCFCTNSICAPSRATILTGKHSHLNGVLTLADRFDGRQQTFPKLLQKAGYQTAIIGKWHLGHGGVSNPTGFDYWNVLPGQGEYHDPTMIEMGERKVFKGYATDIITDMSVEWIKNRDKDRPFCLLCHHKAPHRPWEPDEKHAHMYDDIDIPEPFTFDDDYSNRALAAKAARTRIESDLNAEDLKVEVPPGMEPYQSLLIPENIEGYSLTPIGGQPVTWTSKEELKKWKYQRYIKYYLRCIASIDGSVGRLLDTLDQEEIAEDTIVIYTSDQGFFLGDHGWFDKRFMYEESLRMPFIIRYPREIRAGSTCDNITLNLDFAETFLDYASLPIPEDMQGRSIRPLLRGEFPKDWRTSMYYRYWMHLAHHHVPAHYGIRTKDYKLIYYYGKALGATGSIDEPTKPEWELFDLKKDPYEMNSVYNDPAYEEVVRRLKAELEALKIEAKDVP